MLSAFCGSCQCDTDTNTAAKSDKAAWLERDHFTTSNSPRSPWRHPFEVATLVAVLRAKEMWETLPAPGGTFHHAYCKAHAQQKEIGCRLMPLQN
mmetsp:Transcript_96549/g.171658  ORF Transcript_96549/g.171658 Transcript_96549/m.171658 type:complete len:95 (-) Transcript_96549:75-359(-)